jgi:RNA-splicing ligase RtcB
VHHAIYDKRGSLRPERGAKFHPNTKGEVVWVNITDVRADEIRPVYDIVTADPAHCFLANGIVVHNCGNKAVRLDIPAREVKRKIKKLMDEIY